MGAYTQNKYTEVYDKMSDGQWYTAAELGLAAASVAAMVRRDMLETKAGKPKQYRKKKSALIQILSLVKEHQREGGEYFVAFKNDGKAYGMMCTIKNERVLDCYEKPYDLNGIIKIEVNKKIFNI